MFFQITIITDAPHGGHVYWTLLARGPYRIDFNCNGAREFDKRVKRCKITGSFFHEDIKVKRQLST